MPQLQVLKSLWTFTWLTEHMSSFLASLAYLPALQQNSCTPGNRCRPCGHRATSLEQILVHLVFSDIYHRSNLQLFVRGATLATFCLPTFYLLQVCFQSLGAANFWRFFTFSRWWQCHLSEAISVSFWPKCSDQFGQNILLLFLFFKIHGRSVMSCYTQFFLVSCFVLFTKFSFRSLEICAHKLAFGILGAQICIFFGHDFVFTISFAEPVCAKC